VKLIILGDGNWTRFIELCRIIDPIMTPNDNDFTNQIEKILNIDLYIRFICIEMFVSFLDGPSCSSSNFLLYDNPNTGLFDIVGM
jgi:spore coat protein CotH